MRNKLLKSTIAFITVLVLLFNFTGCAFFNSDSSNASNDSSDSQSEDDSSDAFVELEIDGIDVNQINVDDISVNTIKVNPAIVSEIQNIETETIPINDEFITVAHENFKSVYGDDFDLGKFLKDIAIGSTAILVCVTLSAAGGPVGTYFGAVICSEFAKSSLLIGTAIDAAVSGFQAYKEGGDLKYILGHMLNGVADGYKWSAIIAPASGVFSGISTIKAVKQLKKIPEFAEKSYKELSKILKEIPDVLSNFTKDVTKLSEKELKNLFAEASKNLSKEITEDIFIKIVKNKDAIITIVKKFNPFGVAGKTIKVLKKQFCDKLEIKEEVLKEFIKKIKKGIVKDLESETDDVLKDSIKKNLYEFLELYGSSLKKDFVENTLKHRIKDVAEETGEKLYDDITKVITHTNSYSELVKTYAKDEIDTVLDDSSNLLLLQLRFGSENLNKLRNGRTIVDQLSTSSSDIKEVLEITDNLFEGKIKSLNDIKNATVSDRLFASRDSISSLLKEMKIEKKSKDLFNELAFKSIKQSGMSDDIARDIIENSLSKSIIKSKYGEAVYKNLWENNAGNTIQALGTQVKVNTSLIKDITTDKLKNLELSDEVINDILKYNTLDIKKMLSSEKIDDIGNLICNYYKQTDRKAYSNFVKQYAEIRGEVREKFINEYKNNKSIVNYDFANGIMAPAKPTVDADEYAQKANFADYIKAKYGDIYMTSSGFPIFDDYAVSRLEIPNLTGDDRADRQLANIIHHGSSESPKGYSWHHVEDGKTIILIPKELHDAYKHTGGASLIRDGLKNAA